MLAVMNSLTPRPPLDVTTWYDAARAIVTPTGEVDVYTALQLRATLTALHADGHHLLVVDLRRVTFCDSCGLGALVGAAQRARSCGGAVALANVPDPILRTLRVTGLTQVLPPFATLDEACAHLDTVAA